MVQTLSDCLTSFPVLAVPDFKKPLFSATDSSGAIKIVLFQQADNSEMHQTTACYLHRFTGRKQRYPLREELYALWWDAEKLGDYF